MELKNQTCKNVSRETKIWPLVQTLWNFAFPSYCRRGALSNTRHFFLSAQQYPTNNWELWGAWGSGGVLLLLCPPNEEEGDKHSCLGHLIMPSGESQATDLTLVEQKCDKACFLLGDGWSSLSM